MQTSVIARFKRRHSISDSDADLSDNFRQDKRYLSEQMANEMKGLRISTSQGPLSPAAATATPITHATLISAAAAAAAAGPATTGKGKPGSPVIGIPTAGSPCGNVPFVSSPLSSPPPPPPKFSFAPSSFAVPGAQHNSAMDLGSPDLVASPLGRLGNAAARPVMGYERGSDMMTPGADFLTGGIGAGLHKKRHNDNNVEFDQVDERRHMRGALGRHFEIPAANDDDDNGFSGNYNTRGAGAGAGAAVVDFPDVAMESGAARDKGKAVVRDSPHVVVLGPEDLDDTDDEDDDGSEGVKVTVVSGADEADLVRIHLPPVIAKPISQLNEEMLLRITREAIDKSKALIVHPTLGGSLDEDESENKSKNANRNDAMASAGGAESSSPYGMDVSMATEPSFSGASSAVPAPAPSGSFSMDVDRLMEAFERNSREQQRSRSSSSTAQFSAMAATMGPQGDVPTIGSTPVPPPFFQFSSSSAVAGAAGIAGVGLGSGTATGSQPHREPANPYHQAQFQFMPPSGMTGNNPFVFASSPTTVSSSPPGHPMQAPPMYPSSDVARHLSFGTEPTSPEGMLFGSGAGAWPPQQQQQQQQPQQQTPKRPPIFPHMTQSPQQPFHPNHFHHHQQQQQQFAYGSYEPSQTASPDEVRTRADAFTGSPQPPKTQPYQLNANGPRLM